MRLKLNDHIVVFPKFVVFPEHVYHYKKYGKITVLDDGLIKVLIEDKQPAGLQELWYSENVIFKLVCLCA